MKYKFNWGAALQIQNWAEANGCREIYQKQFIKGFLVGLTVTILTFIIICLITTGLGGFLFVIILPFPLGLISIFLYLFLMFGFNSYKWARESGKYLSTTELDIEQEKWNNNGKKIIKVLLILYSIPITAFIIFIILIIINNR